MTKEKKKIINRKLHQKLLALVDQVSTIRQENGLTQRELGDGIEMDKGQMSRFMSAKKNVTLETVVRIEDFLGYEVLTTPDDRDEALVKDPQRLSLIVSTALRTESGEELNNMLIANTMVRTAVIAGFLSNVPTHTSSQNESIQLGQQARGVTMVETGKSAAIQTTWNTEIQSRL